MTDGGSTPAVRSYDAGGEPHCLTTGTGNRTTYGNDSWGKRGHTDPPGRHAGTVCPTTMPGTSPPRRTASGNTTTYRYNSNRTLLCERKGTRQARRSCFFYDMEGRLCEHREPRRQEAAVTATTCTAAHPAREPGRATCASPWEYDTHGQAHNRDRGGMQVQVHLITTTGRLRKKQQAAGRCSHILRSPEICPQGADLTGKETMHDMSACGRLKSVHGTRKGCCKPYTTTATAGWKSLTIADTIRTDFRYDADKT